MYIYVCMYVCMCVCHLRMCYNELYITSRCLAWGTYVHPWLQYVQNIHKYIHKCVHTYCMYLRMYVCPPFPMQGAVQLALTLSAETEDHVLAATAWSLGQIGRHTPEHAKAVATANVLPRLLDLHLRQDSSEDLIMKVRGLSS